ncbi:hypothetical protein DL93DRAFT_1751004 [Clavulina sp. PMI_390]|nr:hypothetical protein DL93DRAFT_1751004 [Clavulina sp. PMI_390]
MSLLGLGVPLQLLSPALPLYYVTLLSMVHTVSVSLITAGSKQDCNSCRFTTSTIHLARIYFLTITTRAESDFSEAAKFQVHAKCSSAEKPQGRDVYQHRRDAVHMWGWGVIVTFSGASESYTRMQDFDQ